MKSICNWIVYIIFRIQQSVYFAKHSKAVMNGLDLEVLYLDSTVFCRLVTIHVHIYMVVWLKPFALKCPWSIGGFSQSRGNAQAAGAQPDR